MVEVTAGTLGLVAILASCVGGLGGALVYRMVEKARWESLIGPLRTDVADLHDRFDHWTKRERVRASRHHHENSTGGTAIERAMARQEARLSAKRGRLPFEGGE